MNDAGTAFVLAHSRRFGADDRAEWPHRFREFVTICQDGHQITLSEASVPPGVGVDSTTLAKEAR
jgi:hypothetical protein